MTLRDFDLYIKDTINVVVLNQDGRLIDYYDGKDSIMEQFLDREVDKIIRVTFNTVWIQIF